MNGGGGRAGLLLNEHDVYHKKQYQKKDAKYAEERAKEPLAKAIVYLHPQNSEKSFSNKFVVSPVQ